MSAERTGTGPSENGEGGPRQEAPSSDNAAAKQTVSEDSVPAKDDERRAAAEAFSAHTCSDNCPTPCPIVDRHLAAFFAHTPRVERSGEYDPAEVDWDVARMRPAFLRNLSLILNGPTDEPVDRSEWQEPLTVEGPDGKIEVRTDKDGNPIYAPIWGFDILDDLDDDVRELYLLDDAMAQGADAFTVDLWQNLHGREDEVEVWTRRVTAYHALQGFRSTTRPLAPCFDERDLRVDMGGASLGGAGGSRLVALSAHLSERHELHGYWSSPFCAGCWGRPLAEARLQRWLLLNGGSGTPEEEIPEEIPGDVIEIPGDEVDPAEAFVDLDALLDMPEPVMLVDGLVPQNAYGLITGRDGTGKSFLALDLALHVATGGLWYGDRIVDVANYGRALYLVGEGVQSFGKRVQAWLAEHGVARPAPGDLMFRNGTVDLYGGGEAFDALLALVKTMEPDLIVVDTLARSSGAGEANSATDMSIVRDRIDILRRASNGGTVLVVAHTTKGDTDARGSSVIEDDADFVLKVELRDDGRTQVVTVTKQKDGPSGHILPLAMAQVQVGDGGDTTLVLREAGKGATPLNSADDSTRDLILGVLLEQRSLTPKTQADLVSTLTEVGRKVTRQAVGKHLNTLVDNGDVEVVEGRGGKRYRIAAHRIPKDMR